MKNKNTLAILAATFVLNAGLLIAQPSSKINYQAVARNSSGVILANQTVGLRLSIENGPGGPVIYQERHTPTTNQFGLLTAQVGGGTVLVGMYNNIDWSMANLYLLVDMDPTGGTSYTTMGESQLLSVPSANYAASGGTPYTSGTGINIAGQTINITNTAVTPGTYGDAANTSQVTVDAQGRITSASNVAISGTLPTGTNGQTLRNNGTAWVANSIVYNNGINVGIGTSTPTGKLHVKGGSNTIQLMVDAFSGQNIGVPLVKLRNSTGNDLLWLSSNDSTNVFLGYRAGSASTTGFSNTLVGSEAGLSLWLGGSNTAIGRKALYSSTTGSDNTAAGTSALELNTTGINNIAIGSNSLYSNVTGSGAVAIGKDAMFYANNTATAFTNTNIAIGKEALYGSATAANNTGVDNTTIGYEALRNNSTGTGNNAIGMRALVSNTTGNGNCAFGSAALENNVNGEYNIAIGRQALLTNVGGTWSIAIGYQAMRYAWDTPFTPTTHNVAIGREALRGSTTPANNTGTANIALGTLTLSNNTSGGSNTAININALGKNTTGDDNIAIGDHALYNNTIGNSNTAIGTQAFYNNVAGNNATAIGIQAMFYANNSTTPVNTYNTAVGYRALYGSTTSSANTGTNNTSLGANTMVENSTGDNNSAVGYNALGNNTIGNYNVSLGYNSQALNISGSHNAVLGANALYNNLTGTNNIAIGSNAGQGATSINFSNSVFIGINTTPTVARTNVTMLGYSVLNAQCTADNQICLGNTAITQIRAQVTGITAYSDARIKTDVRENVSGLEFINKLKPVTYNERPEVLHRIWGTPDSLYKNIDHTQINNTRFIGFLAQDVEKAASESGFDFPGIDVPKDEKEVYALRYTDFIMPMVKAIQELSAENKELKAQVTTLMNERASASVK
jgi:trimeric autotransporter adhesin